MERQKFDGKLAHGAEDANKNGWRVLGTRKGLQRCETRMPAALAATILISILRSFPEKL